MQPIFVFEDIETAPRRRLFTLFGVPWTATPSAWQSLVFLTVVGLIIALIFLPGWSLGSRLLFGVIYGLLIKTIYLVHDLGHVLGGKYVGAPMDEALITGTRHINIYRGPQDYPSRVHLSRALGGPLLNIMVGIVGLTIWGIVGGHVLLFFGLGNLLFGLGSFVPVPSVDGEVIWRELRRSRS